MIRAEWSLINLLTCAAVTFGVLLPLIPYIISVFTGGQISAFIELYQGIIISGIISTVLTIVFYKIAVGNAKELLSKSEV